MEKIQTVNPSRRKFIEHSAFAAAAMLLNPFPGNAFMDALAGKKIEVDAHLWVYASKYPRPWDASLDLENIFADLSYAGLNGVELMEVNLRHDDAVTRINGLIEKYHFPVSGSSYSPPFNMGDADHQKEILADFTFIASRLRQVKGKTCGISVGYARHIKTEKELDAQAALLTKILAVCNDNGIEPNLHNHTYEVDNGMHDLKGTLARIPDIKLGPDLNWLIRAGVDPVEFINTYGKQIVYLHLRDQYADGKWTEYLGQGVTDFAAIAQALKMQHFNGRAAIELAFEAGFKPVNPLKEDWKRSRQYVKKVFGW